ncbi:unnamed protein product, partial [Prorocentrum cordatum]
PRPQSWLYCITAPSAQNDRGGCMKLTRVSAVTVVVLRGTRPRALLPGALAPPRGEGTQSSSRGEGSHYGDPLSDEGGCDIHGQSTIGAPMASRPDSLESLDGEPVTIKKAYTLVKRKLAEQFQTSTPICWRGPSQGSSCWTACSRVVG